MRLIGAVRIMAACAFHHTLFESVMSRHIEFCRLGIMTGNTELGLLSFEHDALSNGRHFSFMLR